MDLTVDYEALSDVGARIMDLAMVLPDSAAARGDSAGSAAVDEAIGAYCSRLRECSVGAAHALYGLGRGPADAAQAFRETDQSL